MGLHAQLVLLAGSELYSNLNPYFIILFKWRWKKRKKTGGKRGKEDEKRLVGCRGGGAGKADIHVYTNIRYIDKQLHILDN